MTENFDDIDDLLVKVVLGESTPDEFKLVERWRGESPANEHYFQDFQRIWEESRNLAVTSTVDVATAWGSFKERVKGGERMVVTEGGEGVEGDGVGRALDGEGRALEADGVRMVVGEVELGEEGVQEGRVVGMQRRSGYAWLRVAAILFVVVAGGWFYYTFSYRPGQFLSVRSGTVVLSDTLPEGSVVTLNKQSSIRYKRQFAGEMRQVEMEGEAFFSVAQDKDKPFEVRTADGVQIRVLGTSFNVRSMGSVTEVIVETGLVEINKGGHVVRVGAHEKAVFGAGTTSLVSEKNTDDLYNYYRTNAFECNGTPLWRLVEKLNEVYGSHIVIGDDRLRDLPLTTTFVDESLDGILGVIAKTFSITITRKGQEIVLK